MLADQVVDLADELEAHQGEDPPLPAQRHVEGLRRGQERVVGHLGREEEREQRRAEDAGT